MDNYWKDIWKEEPPRYKPILFILGNDDIHIGQLSGEEKLRKCSFWSESAREWFECDGTTPIENRVIFWYPVPKFKGEEE